MSSRSCCNSTRPVVPSAVSRKLRVCWRAWMSTPIYNVIAGASFCDHTHPGVYRFRFAGARFIASAFGGLLCRWELKRMLETKDRMLHVDATIELKDYFHAYLDAAKTKLIIACLVVA